MTDRARAVLLIAYEFPPAAGGGVARLTAFVRYLRESGWTPTVLTAEPGPGRPRDESLLADVEGVEVVRLANRNPIWAMARITAPLRAALRPRGAPGAALSARGAGSAATGSPLTTRIARRFFFPDEAVLWARHAARVAPRLAAERGVSVILASGPPFSALTAAVEAGRASGLPVVLDMRDQWRDNVGTRWPDARSRERAKLLERRTLTAADAVVGATSGIVAEAADMGARRVETVFNGFELARMPARVPDRAGPLRVVFLGRFSRDVMDPVPFFEGLAGAVARDPGLGGIHVDVVGPEAPWVGEVVRRLGLTERVTYHGFKPYAEALGIVARADVGLMCVADRPGAADLFPGKLFDYIGMHLPVLFLGPTTGGVARLIAENAAGFAVSPTDTVGIADALSALAARKASDGMWDGFGPVVASRFERRAQVARLSAVLDETIGRVAPARR